MQGIDVKISVKLANAGIVCAFLVLVMHWGCPMQVGSCAWWFSQMCQGFAAIAVPVFFVISGYLLAGHVDEKGWWKQALKKRVFTLLIPFLVWNVLYFLFAIGMSVIGDIVYQREIGGSFLVALEDSPKVLSCILGFNIFRPPYATHLWYVRCLLVLVLISPLVVWCVRRFGLAFVLLTFMIAYLLDIDWQWGRVPSQSLMYFIKPKSLFYFPLGIFLRVRAMRLVESKIIGLGSLAVGIMVLVLRTYCYANNFVIPLKLGFIAIPFLMFAFWQVIPSEAFVKTLSSMSFPVYLIHGMCMGILSAAWLKDSESIIILSSRAILGFCLRVLS